MKEVAHKQSMLLYTVQQEGSNHDMSSTSSHKEPNFCNISSTQIAGGEASKENNYSEGLGRVAFTHFMMVFGPPNN